jgi:hypothetical protein
MKSRFIAVSPDRIERKLTLGPAIYLHEFLTDHQTSADGWVFYGKEFGYAWIRARWLAAPPLRTLKRHMATLKELRLVDIHRTLRGGMRVRMLDSVKFATPIPPPAVQLPLLLPPVAPIRSGRPVEKAVENQCNPISNSAKNGTSVGPKMAPERSKKQVEETNSDGSAAANPNPDGLPVEIKQEFEAILKRLAAAKSLSSKPQLVEMTDEQKQKRIDLLHEQGRLCEEKLKASG